MIFNTIVLSFPESTAQTRGIWVCSSLTEGNPDLAAVVMFICAHDILEPFIKEQYFICMMMFIALHNERLQYACAVHHYDELVWILWKCIALCCREKTLQRFTILFPDTHHSDYIICIKLVYRICVFVSKCMIYWLLDNMDFLKCVMTLLMRVFNIWWCIFFLKTQ